MLLFLVGLRQYIISSQACLLQTAYNLIRQYRAGKTTVTYKQGRSNREDKKLFFYKTDELSQDR